MKYTLLTTLAALSTALSPVQGEELSFEAWSYTGTDIYPSAVIATATVDWQAATEEEEEEAEPEEGGEEAVADEPDAEEAPEEETDAEDAVAADPDETAVLGDANGWVGALLYNVPEGAKIKVEVSGEGWLRPSRSEVTAEEAMEQVIVMPKGIYDFAALGKIRQQRPAVLTVKVSVNGKKLPDQTENVILRGINECPFFVHFEGRPSDDLSWMFAAYVNENHPWIDGILKEALDAGLVDSFDGYQSGNPEKVAQHHS